MHVIDYIKGFTEENRITIAYCKGPSTMGGSFCWFGSTIDIAIPVGQSLNSVLGLLILTHEMGHAWHSPASLLDLRDRYREEKEAWQFAIQLFRELGILSKYRKAIVEIVKLGMYGYRNPGFDINYQPLFDKWAAVLVTDTI
jgi:hypothetical protein